MSCGRSVAVFRNCFEDVDKGETINPNPYSEEEIANAIYDVVLFDTHNGISKNMVINALKWVMDRWVIDHGDDEREERED